MVMAPLSLRSNYWQEFEITQADIDFIYNYLLELETPLTNDELMEALVKERIRIEKDALLNQRIPGGDVYLPKEHYQVGQKLLFPALNWQKGQVIGVRPGHNPEVGPFEVISVKLDQGGEHMYAADLENHALNQPLTINLDDPNLDPAKVLAAFGAPLSACLSAALEQNEGLVRIAFRWFPRALLVDVNPGYLNLAEAVLDMEGGKPLSTPALLEHLELPTDANSHLTEFSLNYALQEDERFDEVGPSGEVLWFLKRLEPEAVLQPPLYLRYTPDRSLEGYNPAVLTPAMLAVEKQLDDELAEVQEEPAKTGEAAICLTYPHWRAGTLPLTRRIQRLFPTALEAPRIQFTLVDGDTGTKYPAWVVRNHGYVLGLRDWYAAIGLIPGSLVRVLPGKKPGEVIVQAEKRKSSREWIRTVLVGSDGGVVYAMLKQPVTAAFDDRMAIMIPDYKTIDPIWEQSNRQRGTLLNAVQTTMGELAKLNPQGHVHAQDLYAAVNVLRRCPPGPLFYLLATNAIFSHVGDMYYRLSTGQEED